MDTPSLRTLALCLCSLSAACAPKGERAEADKGSGAGVPADAAGVTATPVAQVAKVDYGTQHSTQGGQLLWTNAATGVPAATAEYACSTEHTVAIDAAPNFTAEPAGSCPDGKQFYKYTW